MREIKFRAWDKERQDMRQVKLMDWSEWWVSTEGVQEEVCHPLDFGERNSFKNEDTDRHILMQYTGLKDRNGKEIYEGDILRDQQGVGEVEWVQEHCAFCVRAIEPHAYHLIESDGQLKHTEVIGNIYENPELLEAQ